MNERTSGQSSLTETQKRRNIEEYCTVFACNLSYKTLHGMITKYVVAYRFES